MDFPCHQHENKRVYNVQEVTTVNVVATIVMRIYAAVENRQADHQAFVVELEGIIIERPISVLIEPGYNLSYISPRLVEAC
jgi:hypothetical protein